MDAAPASGGTTTTETTYVVRAGDALAGIAYRHGVRLSALLRANSLTLTSIIHPGDRLVIPAGATPPTQATTQTTTRASTTAPRATTTGGTTYVVRSGDALASIAWRHGVRLGALLAENGLSADSLILPGRQLRIPPATRPVPSSTTGTASSGTRNTAVASTSRTATGSVRTGSIQKVLSYLTAQVGAPYKFFSAGPDAFDCSGLVVAGFRQVGVNLPHQSRALARMGTSVAWRTESIQAGDLVFTSAFDDPERITHVGIALDSRRWIHAVGHGRTVTIGSMPRAEKIMAVQRIAVG
ncbi:MAG: LysM peptidoglycan-binding domain-containing protein [Acidobacteriota bacterium]